jgi:hypothetical protein
MSDRVAPSVTSAVIARADARRLPPAGRAEFLHDESIRFLAHQKDLRLGHIHERPAYDARRSTRQAAATPHAGTAPNSMTSKPRGLMTCETEGESVTIHEDPGWRSSLRGLWRHWTALIGSVMRLRAKPVETNGLVLLRSVFLVLVAVLLLLVVPLRFIGPWDGGDERWVPWAVVAIGIISLAWVARIRRRPLPTTSPGARPVVTEHCSSSGSVPPRTRPCWGSLACSRAAAPGSISSAWPSVSLGCG